MAKKNGFLLIELIIALSFFTFLVFVFSYFNYNNMKIKKTAIKRADKLDNLVRRMELIKTGIKDEQAEFYNVKITKQLSFNFVKLKDSYIDPNGKESEIMIIGPLQ